MADSTSIEQPFPIFFDKVGKPLDSGYVYIGEYGKNPQTNPIQAFWDEALTQPAAQPIRTINGYYSRYGTPSRVFIQGISCSLTVRDKYQTVVYSDLRTSGKVAGLINASVILDESGLTQQQWNNGIDSISDLSTLTPKNGNRVFVKPIQKWYTFNSSNTEPNNNVTVIGNWVMDIQDEYLASWFATQNVVEDQREGLQTGWDYASSKNSKFIFDGIFYVAQLSRIYSDGLERKIGLQVPDNSITFFKSNASIKLIPNNEPLGYVVNFYLAENFKMYNPVVFGDVDEHTGTTDESNHCYNIVNCKNGYIHEPVAYNAWGDGFYIGVEYSSLTNKQCEDITIFEPHAEHCGRAGMSITSSKNLNVYSPSFKNIFRVFPKVGLNIEGEGVGETKPSFNGINIHGSITSESCDIGASIYIFDSLVGDVSVNVGNIIAKTCVVPVVTQLFSNNSGSVTLGNIYATAWTSTVLRNNWSQINCQLNIGDIHSINANCNGTVERFSCVVSTDIDSSIQPLVNIGNFSIGDIYISDIAPTKVMHPYYFKDNTAAIDGARKLDKGRIGKINGSTQVAVFFADGQVTSNFMFSMKYNSYYFQPPMRPYLYSEINIEASGGDFQFNVGLDYKTPLTITKYDVSVAPIKIVFPVAVAVKPLVTGVNNGFQTTVSGTSLAYKWRDATTVFIDKTIGTLTTY